MAGGARMLSRFRAWLRSMFMRRRLDREMRDEMEDLEFEIREYKDHKKDLIEETLRHLSEEEEE